MATQPLASNPVERRPPQFSLRMLFWLITVFSALFAAMTAVGMVWSLLLLLLVSLAVAHVLGNAIGTRLRDDATKRIDQSLPQGGVPQPRTPSPAMTGPAMSAPALLRERRPLGQLLFVVVAAGAVAGALLGRLAFHYVQWQPPAASDAIVGIVSCAVLGAIAGFMASGFFKIALWPAVKYFFSRK